MTSIPASSTPACITVTGFGLVPTSMTYEEWADDYIQSEEAALHIAHHLMDHPDETYPYNEDDKPVYYQEFDVCDVAELKSQVAAFESTLDND